MDCKRSPSINPSFENEAQPGNPKSEAPKTSKWTSLPELPKALLGSQSGPEQSSSCLAAYSKSTARCLRVAGFLLVHTDETWVRGRESCLVPGNCIPACHSAPGKKANLCHKPAPGSQQSIHPQGALCFLNHQNNSVC